MENVGTAQIVRTPATLISQRPIPSLYYYFTWLQSPERFLSMVRVQAGGTARGGQQVCNEACRPCNSGVVTGTTQEEIFSFLRESHFWRENEAGSDAGEGYRRQSCQEEGQEEKERKKGRKRGKEGSKERVSAPM